MRIHWFIARFVRQFQLCFPCFLLERFERGGAVVGHLSPPSLLFLWAGGFAHWTSSKSHLPCLRPDSVSFHTVCTSNMYHTTGTYFFFSLSPVSKGTSLSKLWMPLLHGLQFTSRFHLVWHSMPIVFMLNTLSSCFKAPNLVSCKYALNLLLIRPLCGFWSV